MAGDLSTTTVGTSQAVGCPSRSSIVFWGSHISFSDWTLRVAEAESGSMDVCRAESLEEIELLDGAPRYVFFDDSKADIFLTGSEAVRQRLAGVRWVLAYRDEVVARRMLYKRRESPELSKVRLLQMNLPIDIWTPMFRLVLSGDFVVPGSLLEPEPGPADPEEPSRSREIALTGRESQVLSLVARGMRNKTIAHELGLSEHTIKLHLHHVISKIGVRNRTEATQWYLTQSGGARR